MHLTHLTSSNVTYNKTFLGLKGNREKYRYQSEEEEEARYEIQLLIRLGHQSLQ